MKYRCLKSCFVNGQIYLKGETWELPDSMRKSEKHFQPLGQPVEVEPEPKPSPEQEVAESWRSEKTVEETGEHTDTPQDEHGTEPEPDHIDVPHDEHTGEPLAEPKPEPETPAEGYGDYLCPKCKVTHRAGSKVHKRHLKLLE